MAEVMQAIVVAFALMIGGSPSGAPSATIGATAQGSERGMPGAHSGDALLAADGIHLWLLREQLGGPRFAVLHHELHAEPPVLQALIPPVLPPLAIAAHDGTLWFAYARDASSVIDLYRLRMRRHDVTDRWYAVPWGRLEPAGFARTDGGTLLAMGVDAAGALLVVREGDGVHLVRPAPPPGHPGGAAAPARLQLPAPATATGIFVVTGLSGGGAVIVAERDDAGTELIELSAEGAWYALSAAPLRIDDPGRDVRRSWTSTGGDLVRVRRGEAGRVTVSMHRQDGWREIASAPFDPALEHSQIFAVGSAGAVGVFFIDKGGIARHRFGLDGHVGSLVRVDESVTPPRVRQSWPAAAAVLLSTLIMGLEFRRASARARELERADEEGKRIGRPVAPPPAEAIILARAVAAAIDLLPLLLISGLILGISPIAWLGVSRSGPLELFGAWVMACTLSSLLVALPDAVLGMTPGKMVMGLRVVPAHGRTHPVRTTRRAVIKAASLACPLLLIAGLCHPRGWCLHDRCGRSIVVGVARKS